MKESSGWCAVCQRQVLVRKPKPNHVLHALLFIFTIGLWLFIWAIMAMVASGKPWRCTVCGSPAAPGQFVPPAVMQPQGYLPAGYAPSIPPPPPIFEGQSWQAPEAVSRRSTDEDPEAPPPPT